MQSIVIVLFGLLIGSLAYSWEPEELECASALDVNKTWIEENNNPIEKPIVINNNILNDFLECYFQKLGWIVKDAINWDKIEKDLLDLVDKALKESAVEYNEPFVTSLLEDFQEGLPRCRTANLMAVSPGQSCAIIQNCIGRVYRDVMANKEVRLRNKRIRKMMKRV